MFRQRVYIVADEQELRRACERLVSATRTAVENGQIGALKERSVEFIQPKNVSVEYKDGIAYAKRELSKDSVAWLVATEDSSAAHAKIVALPEYQQAVELAVRFSSLSQPQCEELVGGFVHHVCLRPHYYFDEPVRFDALSTLLADLRGEPIPWCVDARLMGVWTEAEGVRLPNGQIIRQLKPADFEHKLLPSYGSPIDTLRWEEASAMLEWTFHVQHGRHAQERLNVFMSILRLFCVGSVDYLEHMLAPWSFRDLGGSLHSAPKHPRFVYQLRSSEVSALEAFEHRMFPLIGRQLPPFSPTEEGDDIGIAYERFSSALFQSGPVEAVITTAITALEALFLENQGELTRRLAQRVAILMRLVGDSPLSVATQVAEAYKIRSRFVHGTGIKTKLRDSYKPSVL
jgi:hypothetical protein